MRASNPQIALREINLAQPDLAFAPWIWALPPTYVVHIGEEYWAGGGFPAWISSVWGVHLPTTDFLIMNGAAVVLMIASLAWLSRRDGWRWSVTAIAGTVMLNGISHAIASLITHTYSPGLITGMLLWVPLGLIILSQERRNIPRSIFGAGVLGAMGLHAVVCFLSVYG